MISFKALTEEKKIIVLFEREIFSLFFYLKFYFLHLFPFFWFRFLSLFLALFLSLLFCFCFERREERERVKKRKHFSFFSFCVIVDGVIGFHFPVVCVVLSWIILIKGCKKKIFLEFPFLGF